MATVGAYEAKTKLPELLDRVCKGEEITITRHGVPVALLTSAAKRGARNVEDTIRAIRAFRKGRTLAGLSIREMINEGRR
ncbi:MAG TPA: type II toxin-antitoxin system prevent-host-death family antitoxin [Candidatus Hydrogenedentes bacterium]|nr:type II toxin-antitoxin system prevent-host-death family antitoxin [Candidatus Hydrogenedentota bacterium]HNT89472.1 type II toxin-antitoxin system prevent-host-death family antitoxin [Candidatus Hydrogenedentota bacterium]